MSNSKICSSSSKLSNKQVGKECIGPPFKKIGNEISRRTYFAQVGTKFNVPFYFEDYFQRNNFRQKDQFQKEH